MALITLLSSHRHHCAQLTLFSAEYIRLTLYLSKMTYSLSFEDFCPSENKLGVRVVAGQGGGCSHSPSAFINFINCLHNKNSIIGKIKRQVKVPKHQDQGWGWVLYSVQCTVQYRTRHRAAH